MGSLDDLFIRKEVNFKSYNEILAWLSDDGRRKESSFQNTAAILAEPYEISQRIKEAKMLELERIQTEIDSLEMSKARNKLTMQLKSRKREIESDFQRIERQTETKYKSQIKEATTIGAVSEILTKAERDTVPKTFNKINDEANRRIKEIRKEQAQELEKKQKEAKEERLRQEALDREAEKKEKIEAELERREEANRIRLEAEKERQREIEREYQRELRFQEEQLNLQEQT